MFAVLGSGVEDNQVPRDGEPSTGGAAAVLVRGVSGDSGQLCGGLRVAPPMLDRLAEHLLKEEAAPLWRIG